MPEVAIVTDSIACLTPQQIEQYRIRVVATNILVNGKAYQEGIDITAAEAYRLLETNPEQFTTSAPSPGQWLKVYREMSEYSGSILCITLSSKLSTLHNAALVAKEQAEKETPGIVIEVLDSQTAAAAEGFIVLAAARAAAEGRPLPEVVQAAETVMEKVNFFAVMETVRYVYRTGRVPEVAAWMGSVFKIKPLVTLSQGKVHLFGVTRTKRKGIERIIQMMRQKVGTAPVHVAVVHAGVPEEGEKLRRRVEDEFNCVELWLSEFSPVMGYSTGPGLLGLAFYPE